jgi:hypothetical protein
MTAAETILPDIPDGERTRELRFHLRSLQRDIATSIARLETCLPVPAMEPAAMWQLRETVSEATAAIAHDARHHAQRTLDLVSMGPGGDDRASADDESEDEPAVAPSLTGPGSDETRAQLANELGVTLAALARVQAIIAEVATTRGNEVASLSPRVTLAAEAMRGVAWPAAQRCLALARALHHAADPAAAEAEAREDELTTPLNEVSLAGARSLDICPRCGARLTDDDRTHDGSYCEVCRSRFFEPVLRSV